ncbi:universal stress protein [Micrococcales bacterium 31B]|nr:universal stress protein [Micrococcales bacterium 31B]
MTECVIVGVDGGDTAFRAASRAAALAMSLDAELIVLTAHARDNNEIVKVGGDTWELNDADQAQRLAAHVAAKLGLEHPDLSVRALAVQGKPQDALTQEAARSKATLLVVGNVGMRGLGRLLGSVASSVAHNAPCDVLIVKTAK